MDSVSITPDILKKCCEKNGSIEVINKLKGTVFDDKYVIGQSLCEGAYGKIYSGFDIQSAEINGTPKPIILKFTKKHSMNDIEFEALTKIGELAKRSDKDFVETYAKGKVLILDPELCNNNIQKISDQNDMLFAYEDQIWSYIVQEQLGETLEECFFSRDIPYPTTCCYSIGLQLLDQIKLIHEAGYTYNDLKLENIMIGYPSSITQMNLNVELKIVDLGLVQKYIDDKGQHIQEANKKKLQGNILFASHNLLNCRKLSRRDDLISLCYLLLYIIDGDLPFLSDEKNGKLGGASSTQTDIRKMKINRDVVVKMKEQKKILTPQKLCVTHQAQPLLPFLEEIFSYSFKQEPNYEKLKEILIQCQENEVLGLGSSSDKSPDSSSGPSSPYC